MYSGVMETSRDRLVTAMSDLMWERGYAATSPREVRERSGVGQGGMYHHFSGKHALALAALERNCADLLPGSLELLEGEGTPLVRLRAYLSRDRDALRGCKVGRLTQDPEVASDPELLAPWPMPSLRFAARSRGCCRRRSTPANSPPRSAPSGSRL